MAGTGVVALADPERLGPARWRGQQDRLEVWYLTFTGDDGSGYWLHYETVAPHDDAPAYAHGWAAVFPPDREPVVARFGPATPDKADRTWFGAAGVHVGPDGTRGAAGDIEWSLTLAGFADASRPLYTFPRVVWHRELLPGAQIVPWPRVRITGSFTVAGRHVDVDAVGALARIYGHGNAERWCWLHADLGDGALLEVVSATSRRPGLSRLPMLAMVQLRVPGEADWPRRPLLAAPRFRTRLTDTGFCVSGRVGRRRIRVEVAVPEERSVALGYTDPDGATATCTNSERADATIEVRGWNRGWRTEHHWDVAGTAHAEVGRRP